MAVQHICKRLNQIAALHLATLSLAGELYWQNGGHFTKNDTLQIVEIALVAHQRDIADDLVTDQNWLDNTRQPLLSQKLIRQNGWQQEYLSQRWSCLKAYLLRGVLYNHPFATTAGKIFTHALNTGPLHAQLHQLMSNLGR